jgi:predicted transcriptional regulator
MELKEKIYALKALGWSQQAIAQAVGVNQSTIHRLRNGDFEPRVSTYRAIMALKGRKK